MVSITDVCRCVQHMWPLLHEVLNTEISWPSKDEWRNRKNIGPELPGVVGIIDGTSHEIQPPRDNQRAFYSGCRKYHFIHTQIICDNNLNIRYISPGFNGHENDAQIYHQLPEIGENAPVLRLPPDCWILADSIYPCSKPLLTPYRSNQFPKNNPDEFSRRQRFNDVIRKHRVYVEHVIGRVKQYKIISSIHRHELSDLQCIVFLCACLTQRRHRLFETL